MSPSPARTILILGASSWIGHYLTGELHTITTDIPVKIIGTFCANKPAKPDDVFPFDFRAPASLFSFLADSRPDIVINLLGGVDESLFQFNRKLAGILAENDSHHVFMSSSMVFDGRANQPHTETDVTQGKSDYGVFKARCEEVVRSVAGDYSIVRISAVHGFAPNKISRTERFLKRLAQNEIIEVDSGVFQNRLSIAQMSKMLAALVITSAQGIFHLGTSDQSEEIDFLGRMAEIFGYSRTQLVVKPAPAKYLTVIPNNIFNVVGDGFKRTELDTLHEIRALPEFQKYKRTV